MNFSNIALLLAFDCHSILTSKQVSHTTLALTRKRITKLISKCDLKLDFTAQEFNDNMYKYLNVGNFYEIRKQVYQMYKDVDMSSVYVSFHDAKYHRVTESMTSDEHTEFVLGGRAINRFKTHYNRLVK